MQFIIAGEPLIEGAIFAFSMLLSSFVKML